MLRTITSVLAAGVLAISAAACSASGQSGCSQPAVQTYPAPQLVTPAAGAANVPDNIGVIQISTQTQVIVGSLALVPASGPTINLGGGTLSKQQPNPNTFLWDIKVSQLQAHMAYTLQWIVSYPGGCLGPEIIQTHVVGGFTTQ